jgi:hypothetical protein
MTTELERWQNFQDWWKAHGAIKVTDDLWTPQTRQFTVIGFPAKGLYDLDHEIDLSDMARQCELLLGDPCAIYAVNTTNDYLKLELRRKKVYR